MLSNDEHCDAALGYDDDVSFRHLVCLDFLGEWVGGDGQDVRRAVPASRSQSKNTAPRARIKRENTTGVY
jgi:hypothetical protein